MVAASPLLALAYLLAAAPGNKGRQRYAPKRRKGKSAAISRRPSANVGAKASSVVVSTDPLPPPPQSTESNGPFPTYFTCRHAYEDTLMEELALQDPTLASLVSSPYPGLVRVDNKDDGIDNSSLRDPVYALQVLPNCRIVKVSNSIKGLAKAISEIPEFQSMLQVAPRGSLVIHALVPGMCKGQKDPKLARRARLVADAVSEQWKRRFSAARKSNDETPKLLLQIMLFSPDVAAASLSQCQADGMKMAWPNPNLPVGLAHVDIDDMKMPSSAYRKLLEAFSCWQCMPTPGSVVVDLGASPGGWTFAVLLHCEPRKVIAVDRAELDPRLMNHANVEFVQGDAFAYHPLEPVDWMVSDIIAYPERIVELLETWCSNRFATRMVVTVKFQGDKPSWEALQQALEVADAHNYRVRAKHFFNNKNEVTIMLQHEGTGTVQAIDESMNDVIRGPIFERAWPKD